MRAASTAKPTQLPMKSPLSGCKKTASSRTPAVSIPCHWNTSAEMDPRGRDLAVVVLDDMLASYYEGEQIALHRISYQKKDMVINVRHYRRLTVKQSFDIENKLLDGDNVFDFPFRPPSLNVYDKEMEVQR